MSRIVQSREMVRKVGFEEGQLGSSAEESRHSEEVRSRCQVTENGADAGGVSEDLCPREEGVSLKDVAMSLKHSQVTAKEPAVPGEPGAPPEALPRPACDGREG